MELQTWTKQSMKQKPFSTAKGKPWTLTPNYVPLETIYTSLNLIQKERGTGFLKKHSLSDITQLLDKEILQKSSSDCTRILVTGKELYCVLLRKHEDDI